MKYEREETPPLPPPPPAAGIKVEDLLVTPQPAPAQPSLEHQLQDYQLYHHQQQAYPNAWPQTPTPAGRPRREKAPQNFVIDDEDDEDESMLILDDGVQEVQEGFEMDDAAGGGDSDADQLADDSDSDFELHASSSKSKSKKRSKKASTSASGEPKSKKAKTSSSKNQKEPRATKPKKFVPLKFKSDYTSWQDIPKWKNSTTCPVKSMPPEIMDKILGDPMLNLRDHISLAGSSRFFRACYFSPPSGGSVSRSALWRGLTLLRPPPNNGTSQLSNDNPTARESRAVGSIWTNRVNDATMQTLLWPATTSNLVTDKETGEKFLKTTRTSDSRIGQPIRSKDWDEAIELLDVIKLTKTNCMAIYKLNSRQIAKCTAIECQNPHYKSADPMLLFNEAAVESKALECHGGAFAHQKLLDKRQATALKAAATRAKNGTTSGGGRRRRSDWADEYDSDDYGSGGYRRRGGGGGWGRRWRHWY